MTDFPDLKVFMKDLVIKDGHAEYHWTLDGTNSGPGGGGQHVRISGFERWKIGDGGLIAESQGQFDSAEYQRQLEHGSGLGRVEGANGILTIRGGGGERAWNNIRYKSGLSANNVGSKKLSMNVATIPPGGVAAAHIHVGFEVMLYILEGRVRHEYGPKLEYQLENGPGDFIFIEPGIPHEVFNMSATEPVVAVVARSDASEWENIVSFARP
jgi:uncharacterized RmlC-like cupin family protein